MPKIEIKHDLLGVFLGQKFEKLLLYLKSAKPNKSK